MSITETKSENELAYEQHVADAEELANNARKYDHPAQAIAVA